DRVGGRRRRWGRRQPRVHGDRDDRGSRPARRLRAAHRRPACPPGPLHPRRDLPMTTHGGPSEPFGGRPPRVLLTLADVPWPADAGKRLRAAATLDGLSAVAEVDVLVLAPPVAGAAPPPAAAASCTRVAHVDLPLRT